MKVLSFMFKQKKENTNISIHLKRRISCWFKLNLSISISAVIFLKRHKKTAVIGIIFNLEKLKRHSRCVDLEESFNKYLYIYCFFKKDIAQIKFSL